MSPSQTARVVTVSTWMVYTLADTAAESKVQMETSCGEECVHETQEKQK